MSKSKETEKESLCEKAKKRISFESEELKKASLMVFIMIGFGICITGIIYSVSKMLQFPHTDLVGTVDGWLGFFGGLCGGIITLIGVWWTIESQNKNKMDELHSTYKPIIAANSPSIEEFNEIHKMATLNQNFISFNNEDRNHGAAIVLYLYLKNIGRGEAIDLTITRTRVSLGNKIIVREATDKMKLTQTSIYKDSKVIYGISFYDNDFFKKFTDQNILEDRYISFDIEYRDIYDKVLFHDIYVNVRSLNEVDPQTMGTRTFILAENCTIYNSNKVIKNIMDDCQIWADEDPKATIAQ